MVQEFYQPVGVLMPSLGEVWGNFVTTEAVVHVCVCVCVCECVRVCGENTKVSGSSLRGRPVV